MESGRLDATIHLSFAFDIGYEIDLERARALLPAESGPLVRRRRTPESIRYRPAPLRTAIDPSGLNLPVLASEAGTASSLALAPPRADLTVFDFGALALAAQFPVQMTAEELLALAGALSETAPLNAAARRVIAPWVERIRPAVEDFEPSELAEEYIVFQMNEVRSDWLAERAAWVAGLVRLEAGPLSREEVAEATRLSLSYTPNDLVTLDWAAGFVADRDCADTLQVIEFANVQLLEFRHIDDRLDDRLEAAYHLIQAATARHGPLSAWRPHGAAVRSVRELEIEATSLFERADNNLKLIGDQYLARVFELASNRFHLRDWEQNIRRKLDTVGDVFDLLIQQAGHTRTEVLEIIVVLLIATEIVLALLRH
jgi:hypothetical protein